MSEDYKSPYVREYIKAKNDRESKVSGYGLQCSNRYLFLYNVIQFFFYTKVVINLLFRCSDPITRAELEDGTNTVRFATYLQLMETIHPMLGLVPGGPVMPFLQVIGRILVNFYLTTPEILTNSGPYAHRLMITWSAIEIWRYLYYSLRLLNINQYFITWCRYSLFMPLYPIGGLCESMCVFAASNYYSKIGYNGLTLPNAANMSFNLPLLLKLYVYLLLWPSILILMKHMWNLRKKQLRSKSPLSMR